MQLEGQTVVVTGAAGDIGARFVRSLAAAGADVIAADVPAEAEAGAALARETGCAFVPTDVTSDDDWAAVVARANGRVDALVNNAAIYRALGAKRPLTDLACEDWDTVLRVNVRGTWQGIKAVVPAMRAAGGGRIVNISSSTARMGVPGFAHYVASKAAVEGLTRAAARELGPDRITVNAVAPGLVSDAATRALNDDAYIAAAAGGRALAREMVPDDLVGAVLFLVSDAAGFMTGQTVVVDGGVVFA
jgi:NAD(P)-dependent dehydrogenase (short-subunit alcohol dehydrogenase family)